MTEPVAAALEGLRGREDMHEVAWWQVEAGPDSTGDPAVWVWLILHRDDVDFDTRTRIRELVRETVAGAAQDPRSWVYVRFRTVAEEEEAAKTA